jgi:hypothetical protein
MNGEREREPTGHRPAQPRRRARTDGYWEDELMQYAWTPRPQLEEPDDFEHEPSNSPQLATSDF